jgi:hypothetical protein
MSEYLIIVYLIRAKFFVKWTAYCQLNLTLVVLHRCTLTFEYWVRVPRAVRLVLPFFPFLSSGNTGICCRFLTCGARPGISCSIYRRFVRLSLERLFLCFAPLLLPCCIAIVAISASRLNELPSLAPEHGFRSTSRTKLSSGSPLLLLVFGVRSRSVSQNTVRVARSDFRYEGPRTAIGRFCNLSTCRPMYNEAFVSDRKCILNIPSASVGREQTQNLCR